VSDPGIQLYEEVPAAFSVALLPIQIVALGDDAVTVGCAPTVMRIVCRFVQPFAAVPVTEYVVVTVGVTTTLGPVSDPGIHKYVDAPVALSVVFPPVQIELFVAVGVTVGEGFTVMTRVAVLVQPFAAVPVTTYVVVVVGETVTVVPVNDPGIQLYVVAPVPVIVVLLPEQIVAPVVVVATVGVGITVMTRVAVPVHPAEVPVTTYVVVVVGETVTVVPVNDPGIHEYVVAPDAVMDVELPLQIVADVVVVVTVGVGFTVITRVAVLVHPFAAVPVTTYVVVVVGETVTVVPVSDPGIHEYVDAPDAVIVVELPEQIVVVGDVVATVGVGITVITRVAVLVHPPEVPVTTYVVVVVGETVTVVPVSDPGIHVYVVAPDAVMDVELPLQIVAPVVVVVTVGVGVTVTRTVCVLVHPFAAVPVTTYVVVVVGETVTVVPVNDPGIHA